MFIMMIHPLLRKQKGISGQRAAVIVLFLILLPIMIAAIATMFEFAMIQVAQEQARAYSRLLSLAAIKQYSDSEILTSIQPKDRFMERLANVKNRINTLAADNAVLINKNSDDFRQLGYNWSPDASLNKGGLIVPGRYYFSMNEGEETSPCSPSSIQPPCFVEFTESDYNAYMNAGGGAEPVINAFKISAGFRDSYLTRMAGFIVGNAVVRLHSQAVATTIPRTVVFLVDISNSTTVQTHRRRSIRDQQQSPENGRGRYFSFNLTTPNPSYPPGLNCNEAALDAVSDGDYCQWRFLRDWNPANPGENKYVTGSGIERVGSSLPESNRVHFWDDYEVVETFKEFDSDDLAYHVDNAGRYTSGTAQFLIDQVSDPQPLSDILDGLDSALDAFIARQNVGDKAQLIFFETSLIWSRVTKLTGDFIYLKKLTDPAARGERLKALGLFPSNERFTNLSIALEEGAERILANPLRQKDVPTSDAIVYIGDFLPNCSKVTYGEDCGENKPCIANCTGLPCQTDCSDDYPHFNKAIGEINNLVLDKLVPNRITFNTILIGDYVGPHVLDIQRDPGDPVCITDLEARARNQDFVMGGNEQGIICPDAVQCAGSYINMQGRAAGTPFYQAGFEAYRISRMTGGIFAPILTGAGGNGACVPDNSSPRMCTTTPARRFFDPKCAPQLNQIKTSMEQIVRGEQMFIVAEAE